MCVQENKYFTIPIFHMVGTVSRKEKKLYPTMTKVILEGKATYVFIESVTKRVI
jgi:hypothetical protein